MLGTAWVIWAIFVDLKFVYTIALKPMIRKHFYGERTFVVKMMNAINK